MRMLAYWNMVADLCRPGTGDLRLRFLKFLLAGFCMIVQQEPGDPVGMRFPGGDRVELIDGVYYCPVRDKAGDVDVALCPFCPGQQTPGSRDLKPPVNASDHRNRNLSRTATGMIILTGEIVTALMLNELFFRFIVPYAVSGPPRN